MPITRSVLLHTVMATAASSLILFNMALAQSSCEATNDNEDAQCSISCPSGQAAECSKGTGSSSPECRCTGTPTPDGSLESLFLPRPQTGKAAHFFSTKPAAARANIAAALTQKLSELRDYKLGERCGNVAVGRECRGECRYSALFVQPDVRESPSMALERLEPDRCRARSVCRDVVERRCTGVTGKLTLAGPVTVEDVKVQVHEPDWDDIPLELLGYRVTYTNCNPEKQGYTFTHTERAKTGYRVVKGRTVEAAQEVSANINFEFKAAKAGGGVKFNNKVSVSQQDDDNQEKEDTLMTSVPVVIPTMHKVIFEHIWTRTETPIKYEGTVHAQALLSPNLEGVTLVSQVLPNDRMFPINGTILLGRLAEGNVMNNARVLTSAECSQTPGWSVKEENFYQIQ